MALELRDDRAAFRFWSRVRPAESGCWEWTGQLSNTGYGEFPNGNRRKVWAHRMAFAMCVGPIPAGMFVLHSCDNPRCINPSHLSLGTPRDNVNDMIRKGRMPDRSGEGNGRARLSVAQVREIVERRARGDSVRRMAQEYGVGITTIRNIYLGETWKSLNARVGP